MCKRRTAAREILYSAFVVLYLAAQSGQAQGIGRLQPKHGGVLFASGPLDAEFVLSPKGSYQIYFTDSSGEELPASTVNDLTLTIRRPDGGPQHLALKIDDSGESWAGVGTPTNGASIAARLSYTFHGKTEQTEIPFANGYHAEFKSVPQQVKAGDPIQLVFTIRDFFGKAVPALQIEHTKPMHLMIVSR